jgi:hypothetical protein
MKRKRTIACMFGLTSLMFAAFFLYFGPSLFLDQEYKSFPSPDGKYRVVVFRKSTFPSVMPGQSGDSPGAVRLYDHNGNVLQQAKVEMVQLVDRVDWESRKVIIKFVADWELPSE